METKEQEWVAEAEVIRLTGLSVRDLRRARNSKYKADADWKRMTPGGQVFWHQAAAGRLFVELGMAGRPEEKGAAVGDGAPNPAGLVAGATPKNGAGDGADDVVVLQVWRGPAEGIKNRAMVEAYRQGRRPVSRHDILRVFVTDNRRLRRDMVILCRHKQADLYELWKGSKRTAAGEKEL